MNLRDERDIVISLLLRWNEAILGSGAKALAERRLNGR
jgi:hypothetical protein